MKATQRQQQIYNYIVSQVKEQGYPPSVREIAQAVGLSSPSTVHTHLATLEKKGYIRRDPSKPRAIVVCHIDGDNQEGHIQEAQSDTSFISLPLLGQVAAGTPILAEQNVEEIVKLPISVVGDKGSFLLKVRGESMIEAGIFDGDYVVVQEAQSADNGDIVVAVIEDEATVKTFYKEATRVRLQPENASMVPIYAVNPHIVGKVTALFRTL
ncbi:MAG: transcriptional repressor LexA [Coriobacteriia bacterium]|nr:transcriptional repressor LexA [Coriobacteriia bacterium]